MASERRELRQLRPNTICADAYDLRHLFASLLLGQGESLKVVSELLGHQDSALTLRTYSHVLPQAKSQAMDRLDALLHGHLSSGRMV